MMVLKRGIGQSFYINDNIRIEIRGIQNGRFVRFAIDAPVEIPVHRLEIHELIQAENRAAISGDALARLKGMKDE